MTSLTNEFIIQSLNNSTSFMILELIAFSGVLIFFEILFFFQIKKEKKSERKKYIIMIAIITAFLFGNTIVKGFLKYNAIQYSIEKNCFEVITDTIVRRKASRGRKGNPTYNVYLTNNGKVTVSSKTYYDCFMGNSVYVVIAKGRFGGKYPTGQLYLTGIYQYVDY